MHRWCGNLAKTCGQTIGRWPHAFAGDEKGKIVKASDHLMDATKYLVVSGRDHLRVKPKPHSFPGVVAPTGPGSWVGW